MILRASSLNPFASATLRVASECQKVSNPDAGEARRARSMSKAMSFRNISKSPASRLEQHQYELPIILGHCFRSERTFPFQLSLLVKLEKRKSTTAGDN